MKKALVVDDSSYFRDEITSILISEGYEVIQAKNGLDGYNKYVKYMPDVVTMDIMMPILDGFGSISKILEFDKKAKIVICSSMMFLDVYKAEGLMAGAKACISKPFSKIELITAIDDAILGE